MPASRRSSRSAIPTGAYGDDPRRRYYIKNADGERVAQIHLYILPACGWDGKLAFHDARRADPALAAEYGAEKWRVADAVGWDKSVYSRAKGSFVEHVLGEIWRDSAGDI